MWVQSLGWDEPLEEEMATHSNILPWEIPWTEVPGGLQSMGSQRGSTRLNTHMSHRLWETSLYTRERWMVKWQIMLVLM